MIEESDLIDAGEVAPGDRTFRVVYCTKHNTLRSGDRVRVVRGGSRNYLLRLIDLTLHTDRNIHDQYPLLVPETVSTEGVCP